MAKRDTRELLLDATVKVVNDVGFHRTTMDAIAAEAGVSKGGFTHYFKTKNQCLLAVVDREFERIWADAEALCGEMPDRPGRKLKAYVRSWIKWHDPSEVVQMQGMLEEPEIRERVIAHRVKLYESVLDGSIPEFVAQKMLLMCAGLAATLSLVRATDDEMRAFGRRVLDEMLREIDAATEREESV